MRVIELDTSQYPQCITGTPNEAGTGRSEGTLHLSRIYRDMEETALRTKGDRDDPEVQDRLSWYAAGGWIWERAFSMAYQESVLGGDMVRPDEWTLDGITGSPDCIRVSDWTVIELKFRWMSSRKFDSLEKWFWVELIQCKGYCKLVGTLNCELHVFFCNGDYRPPVPKVRAARMTFTEQEIEESWRHVKQHAVRRKWLAEEE
jgi:hypothetical protein